jgi:hypothetical protein
MPSPIEESAVVVAVGGVEAKALVKGFAIKYRQPYAKPARFAQKSLTKHLLFRISKKTTCRAPSLELSACAQFF